MPVQPPTLCAFIIFGPFSLAVYFVQHWLPKQVGEPGWCKWWWRGLAAYLSGKGLVMVMRREPHTSRLLGLSGEHAPHLTSAILRLLTSLCVWLVTVENWKMFMCIWAGNHNQSRLQAEEKHLSEKYQLGLPQLTGSRLWGADVDFLVSHPKEQQEAMIRKFLHQRRVKTSRNTPTRQRQPTKNQWQCSLVIVLCCPKTRQTIKWQIPQKWELMQHSNKILVQY